MFGYRLHVYERYVAAVATANDLALEIREALATESPADLVPSLMESTHKLERAVDSFLEALPEGAMTDPRSSGLARHLGFLNYWLRKQDPQACVTDPVGIAQYDLPAHWESFTDWYQEHSAVDADFTRRIKELLDAGHTDSAVRKGWAILKTRLVRMFDLPAELDGEKLAVEVFGGSGSARGLLPDRLCEAYLNLFKALYTLSRNPTVHNDDIPDQQEAEAVLMLTNSALANLDRYRAEPAGFEATPSQSSRAPGDAPRAPRAPLSPRRAPPGRGPLGRSGP